MKYKMTVHFEARDHEHADRFIQAVREIASHPAVDVKLNHGTVSMVPDPRS